MNTPDLETRLKNALAIAAAPRSIVDDVMRRLPASVAKLAPRSRWRRPLIAAGIAAPTVIAATLVFALFFAGSAIRLTLADVQAAVERQAWAHIRYDAGQLKETWINLRTGEAYTTRFDGNVVYFNDKTNTRLEYWKDSGVIRQDAPIQYARDKASRPPTPQTAWEHIISPLEDAATQAQRAKSAVPTVVSTHDTLGGKPVIRFDTYTNDALEHRFLYSQLWADPRSRLPVRVRTRLQLGERGATGKEWSTGDYDFPATGPADLYALGVPRGTPIHKDIATAAVQPILDGINRAHDGFLKQYRAVVWTVMSRSIQPIESLHVIWRNGDKLREDYHEPWFELQRKPSPPLPSLNSKALFAWAVQHEPIHTQLMDSQREYTWTSAAMARKAKPQVRVMRHQGFPLLDQNAWPEQMQWPTRYRVPDFQLREANADTPAGCIGLRFGGDGNSRIDYYIDPANDSVCVKQIWWAKRGTEWTKTREYDLSDLHRVAGHVVAGTQRLHCYRDAAQHLDESTQTTTISVVPLTASDYPPAVFDPAPLTIGANVEGF